MNKKRFYIVSTCIIVAILVVFEIVMYCFAGEEILLQKGPIRTFWIIFPSVIIGLSFVRDLIIHKKFDNDKK